MLRMKRSKYLFFSSLCLIGSLVSCDFGQVSTENKDVLIVERYQKLDNFASGSGMVFYEGSFYMVGDDDPYLVEVNFNGAITDTWLVWDTVDVVDGRIQKAMKHDFEAMSLFPFQHDTTFLIFGSGSVTPNRDLVYTFNPNKEEFDELNGEAFFTWLKQQADLTDEEINLEGACFTNETLFLFNRHNNDIYTISASDVLHFIENGETNDLTLNKQHFELPTFNGDTARFSGASTINGKNKLLFSASIETTDNWEADGEILGSFIGVIHLDEFETKTPYFCRLVYQNDSTRFEGKIEALHGILDQENNLTIYFITDDDDGSTGWGRITSFGL